MFSCLVIVVVIVGTVLVPHLIVLFGGVPQTAGNLQRVAVHCVHSGTQRQN